VTYFHRKPRGAQFSIERLFRDIRAALPNGFCASVAVSRFCGSGIFSRVWNIVEAWARQGDVNHITGDVHYVALLLRGSRTVLTIHDLATAHRLHGWRRRVFVLLWLQIPAARVAAITTISETTRRDLIQMASIDSKKIRVIHNCVSSDFNPVPVLFNCAHPRILQVGTGTNKNLERVVRALAGIPCHLRIIGSLSTDQVVALETAGILYSSSAGLADSQMIVEYSQADMIVFASTSEGFGLPIIEAQATGRPVVTSNISSMPEVAGLGACLVDPFDPGSIRNGIERVIQDAAYREELITQGFLNVERFRAREISRQYADLYAQLYMGGYPAAIRARKSSLENSQRDNH
jgi:glycosyltransferase involved in cell wall biosynthesis